MKLHSPYSNIIFIVIFTLFTFFISNSLFSIATKQNNSKYIIEKCYFRGINSSKCTILLYDIKENKISSNSPENLFLRQFKPGSLFKIITALFLKTKHNSENTTYYCSGRGVIKNDLFKCWSPMGHGNVDIKLALINSCNLYFLNLYKTIEISQLIPFAENIFNYKNSTQLIRSNDDCSENYPVLIGESNYFILSIVDILSLFRFIYDNLNNNLFKDIIDALKQVHKFGTAKEIGNRTDLILSKTGSIKEQFSNYGWFAGIINIKKINKEYILIVNVLDGNGPHEATGFANFILQRITK